MSRDVTCFIDGPITLCAVFSAHEHYFQRLMLMDMVSSNNPLEIYINMFMEKKLSKQTAFETMVSYDD